MLENKLSLESVRVPQTNLAHAHALNRSFTGCSCDVPRMSQSIWDQPDAIHNIIARYWLFVCSRSIDTNEFLLGIINWWEHFSLLRTAQKVKSNLFTSYVENKLLPLRKLSKESVRSHFFYLFHQIIINSASKSIKSSFNRNRSASISFNLCRESIHFLWFPNHIHTHTEVRTTNECTRARTHPCELANLLPSLSSAHQNTHSGTRLCMNL